MSEVHLPHVEVPEPEHVHDPLSRYLAIAIVVATLLTAVTGFLHSWADRTVELSAVRGQRLGIEGMGALLRSQQMAQSAFDTYSIGQEQRTESANAFQRYLFTPAGADREFKVRQKIFDELAARTDAITRIVTDSGELPDITAGSAASPEQDPAFPSRFFATSTRDAVRLRALQDAENEYRTAWEGRTATYTAILTVFAVALFLFGLSLAMNPSVRRLFAVVGTALLGVGLVWTTIVATTPPHHAPESAATAYADGHVALATAHDQAGYRDAVRELSDAIRLRPSFALAYAERAEGEFRAGSPQTAGAASISTPEALDAAVSDLERARDLGFDNPRLVGNLGFFDFELGLQSHDDGRLEAAVRESELAADEQPADPASRFNVGVALLAAGQTDEAVEQFRRGIRLTIYSDPRTKTLRDFGAAEGYVAGSLTDLETVARYRPELAAEVRRIRSFIVGSVAGSAVTRVPSEAASEAADPIRVRADVFPAEVQWGAAIPELDDSTDHVSAQWYSLDSENLGWAVLPNVSGLDESTSTSGNERFELQSFLASSSPPQCLPDGRYRVDLYVNGALAGRGYSRADFGDLEAVTARDLNVALCRPPAWVPSSYNVTGLVTGYHSEDGSRGAYLFRFNRPSSAFGTLSEENQSLAFLESAIQNFSRIFPDGTPTYSLADGTVHTYFMGLDGPTKRYYDYPGGAVRIGAGVSDDGAIIVAVVFGPSRDFATGGLGLRIFDSLSVLEKVPAS